MALKKKSLFLYGFEVTPLNSSLDFKIAALGPELRATLRVGYYSLTSLMQEVCRAMTEVDNTHIYTFGVDRTVSGGLQNRVTILTSGAYLSLLFGTGSRVATSVGPLLGYTATNKTGATSYQSQASAGTVLVSELIGYNYIPAAANRRVQGAVNIAASGDKEAIVFNIMKFLNVEFKMEPEAKVLTQWVPLVDWLIQQRLFEFTPDLTSPSDYFEGTLERTQADGKGLGWAWIEQLPEFPFYYRTGSLTFRQRQV